MTPGFIYGMIVGVALTAGAAAAWRDALSESRQEQKPISFDEWIAELAVEVEASPLRVSLADESAWRSWFDSGYQPKAAYWAAIREVVQRSELAPETTREAA